MITEFEDDISTLDLNDMASGKIQLATFPASAERYDFSAYADKLVRLKGCAPTWAYLLVAAKLLPIAAGIDFVIDDGKEGRIIPIERKR